VIPIKTTPANNEQHWLQCDAMNLQVEVAGPNGHGAIGMAG